MAMAWARTEEYRCLIAPMRIGSRSGGGSLRPHTPARLQRVLGWDRNLAFVPLPQGVGPPLRAGHRNYGNGGGVAGVRTRDCGMRPLLRVAFPTALLWL